MGKKWVQGRCGPGREVAFERVLWWFIKFGLSNLNFPSIAIFKVLSTTFFPKFTLAILETKRLKEIEYWTFLYGKRKEVNIIIKLFLKKSKATKDRRIWQSSEVEASVYERQWLKYENEKLWQIDYFTLPQNRQSKSHVLTMVQAITKHLQTYFIPRATTFCEPGKAEIIVVTQNSRKNWVRQEDLYLKQLETPGLKSMALSERIPSIPATGENWTL